MKHSTSVAPASLFLRHMVKFEDLQLSQETKNTIKIALSEPLDCTSRKKVFDELHDLLDFAANYECSNFIVMDELHSLSACVTFAIQLFHLDKAVKELNLQDARNYDRILNNLYAEIHGA